MVVDLQVEVGFEEQVREGAPEVSPVHVRAFLFWKINILALRTKYLDPGQPQLFAHPDGQHQLPLA